MDSSTLFLKLTDAGLRRAATRLTPRPFVRRVGHRVYAVTGSTGSAYTVQIRTVAAGEISHCDCLAKSVCRHQAAAVIYEAGIRAARRLALEREAGIRRVGRRTFIGPLEI